MDFYEIDDYFVEDIIFWLNSQLKRAGKGYVNPRSVEYEHKHNNLRVWSNDRDEIVAVAIMGKNKTLWNLVVSERNRGHGIGRRILEMLRPEYVRVKAKPVGHLSKAQLDAFEDPTGFYLKNGYEMIEWDSAQNVMTRGNRKSRTDKSILIMRKKLDPEDNKIKEKVNKF